MKFFCRIAINMLNKFILYLKLMRFDKPIGIYLVLWPTLTVLWIASVGQVRLNLLVIFLLGSVVMRAAGCIINDFADRNIDGLVSRTKNRPLATAQISTTSALILFFILLLLALFLVLLLNRLVLMIAIIAAVVTVIYPFLKRYTHLPQIGLGIAFSSATLMVYAAVQHQLPLAAWYLFILFLLWPIMYDSLYAMVDSADDVKIGVKSIAIFFAEKDKLSIFLMQLLIILMLMIFGLWQHFNLIYYLAVVVVFGLFIYQQVLIKDRLPANCFRAFLNNHYALLVVFLGVVLQYRGT